MVEAGDLQLRPITLRQGVTVTLNPSDKLCLRGPVSVHSLSSTEEQTEFVIRPRSTDLLPKQLEILTAKIVVVNKQHFSEITVKNNSMQVFCLTADVILAELSTSKGKIDHCESLVGSCCVSPPLLVSDEHINESIILV